MKDAMIVSMKEAERLGNIVIPFTANLILLGIDDKEKQAKAYIVMFEMVTMAKITRGKYDISKTFVTLDDQGLTFDGFRAVLMVLAANDVLEWGDDEEEDKACRLLIDPRKSPNEEGVKAVKKAIAIVRAALLKGGRIMEGKIIAKETEQKENIPPFLRPRSRRTREGILNAAKQCVCTDRENQRKTTGLMLPVRQRAAEKFNAGRRENDQVGEGAMKQWQK